MKKCVCITACLLATLLMAPFDKSDAGSAQTTLKTIGQQIPRVNPTLNTTGQASRTKTAETGKRQPTITFKDAVISRNSKGRYTWQVRIKAAVNRQVPPNTAMLSVIQNAGGKLILLETRTYDRSINPRYGLLRNDFYPATASDTLIFELIELNPSADKLQVGVNTKNVVERKTVTVPDFGIQMSRFGYSYHPEPAYLYADLKNTSSLPMRVRVVMRAGELSEWTKIRHTEVVLLQKNASTQVKKYWTFTDKGRGWFQVEVETQLLDPKTRKVIWTKILDPQKGTLPTNN